MELLKETIDYVIFAVLGLMGFITIWLTIERLMFFRTLDACVATIRNPQKRQ